MATSFFDSVIINRALALLRIDNFLNKKEILDEEFSIDHPLSDQYNYKPSEFKKLLKMVAEGNYGGLRIYFASSTESKDILTLVFAPTKPESPAGVFTDTGKYFIFNNNKFLEPIGRSDAKQMVDNFKETILPVLQIKITYETKSLFYSINAITELYRYVIAKGPLRSAKIFFSAYLDEDDPYIKLMKNSRFKIEDEKYQNKLTLVFGLRGDNIGKDESGNQRIKNMLVILGGAFGDTGNPCPPPNPPDSCKGALLD